ncbi:hypothetical protein PVAND_012937 [Polypedilum vanderplanki]|uniref:Short/branched chain specific acyl-CoA dehydrogenase, mitochondrial n=1 Tax=Polypedilum vanderplanki TaxID=319348 RepID=A0A9J6CPZ3_POLVA|nr:hypothetical protein PVAND_012937 [Polypedilum vanderplanki]
MNYLRKLSAINHITRALSITSRKNSHFSPLTVLSDDELMMKETFAKFAREKIAPKVREMEQNHKQDPEIIKGLFENGFMGIEIGEEYGGSGLNFMCSILAVEELSKVDNSISVLVDIQNTLINALIAKLGTPEQKKKYLTKLATSSVGSFALSEPSSGSDAFAMKTTAKKDGNHYVINGTKMWISNSDLADVFLLMANADPSKGYKGITTFILEKNMEGLSIGKKEDKLGLVASGTCMIHLDNVRVPEENILGEFGKGYAYAAGFLNEGRIGIGAQMVGCAQGAFDATIPYLLERKQFGQNIYDFQGMQFQIAEVATQIEAGRLLTYNAARLQEAGKPFLKEAAMAKLFCSRMAQFVSSQCVDWMGGVGFTKDFPQEKFYRDSKASTIYEGTSNIQMSTIAKIIRKEYSS